MPPAYRHSFSTVFFTLALVLLVFERSLAAGPADNFFNGHKLLQLCGSALKKDKAHLMARGYCMGYIAGVSQVASLSYTIGYKVGSTGIPKREQDWCIPQDITLTDEIRVVLDYLYMHPDQLDKPQSVLVYRALKQAYPCSN